MFIDCRILILILNSLGRILLGIVFVEFKNLLQQLTTIKFVTLLGLQKKLEILFLSWLAETYIKSDVIIDIRKLKR